MPMYFYICVYADIVHGYTGVRCHIGSVGYNRRLSVTRQVSIIGVHNKYKSVYITNTNIICRTLVGLYNYAYVCVALDLPELLDR